MRRRGSKDPDYYEPLLECLLDEGKLPEDEEEADDAAVFLMFLQQLMGGFSAVFCKASHADSTRP